MEQKLNLITQTVIGAAIEVHKMLGPGLLESAYQECLFHELEFQGLNAKREIWVPLHYKGILIEKGYRIDLLINDAIVVEVKAVEKILPIHEANS
jgi:GxxExxY protein